MWLINVPESLIKKKEEQNTNDILVIYNQFLKSAVPKMDLKALVI